MRQQLVKRIWFTGAGVKRRLARRTGSLVDVIDEYAPGKSFLDVGGMWRINGRDSFRAEGVGATKVTLLDYDVSEEFLTQVRERRSIVRHVQGDVHDPDIRALAGKHDIVYSSGVFYHVPDPVHTLRCLRELTREYLILTTTTIPEVPGLENICVFWPGLPDDARRGYADGYERHRGRHRMIGLTTPFSPEEGYANWWWGMSASAITSMLETQVGSVVDVAGHNLHRRFIVRVRSSAPESYPT